MSALSPREQSAVQKAALFGDPSFVACVRGHAAKHEATWRRLKNAYASGKSHRIRAAQNTMFKSYASKVTSFVRGLSPQDKLTPDEIKAEAAKLDLFSDPGETIVLRLQVKTSGKGARPICMFGRKRRAAQILVRDMIQAKFPPDPADLMARGMGTEIASDWVIDCMRKGATQFVVADIKDFYRSVQPKAMTELLGLPSSVIANCVLVSPAAPVVVSGHTHASYPVPLDGAGPIGLPQGSLVSPLIAGRLLGPTLRLITAAGQARFYGDDILIAASGLSEAKALEKALHEHLSAHPAGPFHLKHSWICASWSGFDFAKYRFRAAYGGSRLRRLPARTSHRRFRERLAVVAAEDLPHKELWKRCWSYAVNWRKSFTRAYENKNTMPALDMKVATIFEYSRSVKAFAHDKAKLARAKRRLRAAIKGR